MGLKAGRLGDFGSSMAEAMEAAMEQEWQALHGVGLPEAGRDDRRLLFAAVAQGMLRYLKDHEAEILSAITLDLGAGMTRANVSDLDLEVEP